MKWLAITLLFILFFPMNSEAFHCKGSHASEPECDVIERASVPVVRDSLGSLIGTWLPEIFVLIKGSPADATYFEAHTFVKVEYRTLGSSFPTEFLFDSRNVNFTGASCTGKAFVNGSGQVGDIFFAPLSLDDFGDITMWVPTDPAMPRQNNIHVACVLNHEPAQQPGFCDCTSGNDGGAPCETCNTGANMVNVVEVEPIQTDLGNFVPDFTITE